MNTDNGASSSVWMATADSIPVPALTTDVTTDVCIVGAGIAGLTTAYLLAREGRQVVVLDDGPIAGGETCRTTAHLVNALDDRYYDLEKLFGEKGARLAAESHTAAVDRIEEIVRTESIDCDFIRLDGYLFLAPGGNESTLDRELEAARRAGLPGIEKIGRVPAASFDTGPCLRFPRQAQFHPLKYLRSVAEAFRRAGGQLFADTHVSHVEGGKSAVVKTSGGATVSARTAIVVATNSPVNDLVAIHTKQAPYRTYVIGARIPRGSVPAMLLWDTADPYHYVRIQAGGDHDILIVGGEDHKTGQANDASHRYLHLEHWTRERFPMIERIDFRWSGQVMEPVDGLAFIGRNPMDADNVFIATGDSGNGMTHGTIAGMLLTDLIAGRPNPWADLYDPSRISKSLQSIRAFASENLNVAAQYADLVTGGDVSSVDDIGPGTGAVIRRGLRKIAVFRDDSGTLHERTAICPHLGCVVAWNSGERTWDCPC
ncbi:MAG: FAD-dependent oxidoreductase, partial [Gemmatimonadales bacterium]|nr:FAD-dependent oxidoreductase [Gemmatimonadales bacterium]